MLYKQEWDLISLVPSATSNTKHLVSKWSGSLWYLVFKDLSGRSALVLYLSKRGLISILVETDFLTFQSLKSTEMSSQEYFTNSVSILIYLSQLLFQVFISGILYARWTQLSFSASSMFCMNSTFFSSFQPSFNLNYNMFTFQEKHYLKKKGLK